MMVVGGYGQVGRRLCRALADAGGLSLIVAGRRLGEARSVAAPLRASARDLDLAQPATWPEACAGVDCVIVCMEQPVASLARFLFG